MSTEVCIILKNGVIANLSNMTRGSYRTVKVTHHPFYTAQYLKHTGPKIVTANMINKLELYIPAIVTRFPVDVNFSGKQLFEDFTVLIRCRGGYSVGVSKICKFNVELKKSNDVLFHVYKRLEREKIQRKKEAPLKRTLKTSQKDNRKNELKKVIPKKVHSKNVRILFMYSSHPLIGAFSLKKTIRENTLLK